MATKDHVVRLRVSEEERCAWLLAAGGGALSSWLRGTANEAAGIDVVRDGLVDVGLVLTVEQHAELEAALAANGNSIQQMLSKHVDRYIEKYASAELSEGDEGGVVADGGRAQKPDTEGDSRTPSEQSSPSESSEGCWDHRGSPKSWCQYCKV